MATGDENVIMKQPTSPFPLEETEPGDGQKLLGETKDVQSDKKKDVQFDVQKDVKPKVKPLSLPSDGIGSSTGSLSRSRSSTTLSPYPPKLRTFSGNENKGETTYDIWKYEVKMLMKDSGYTREQKDFAIRRSLTGPAARMIMYQGLDKSLLDILETLDSVYGNIENKEQLLEDFYSASQRDDEDVSAWSNRLEEIIGKGLERGVVKQSEVNSMLHGKLWMGLREDLKDVSGHKYDTIKDFNKLRIALRQIEKDHKKPTKPNTSKAAIASPYEDELSKLTGMVNQLTQTVTELQGQQQYQPRGQDQFRGNNFRGRPNYRASWNSRGWKYNGPSSRQQQSDASHPFQQQNPVSEGASGDNSQTVYCYRCKQPGHVQIGCRVRLDHVKRPLNFRKPGRRGQF